MKKINAHTVLKENVNLHIVLNEKSQRTVLNKKSQVIAKTVTVLLTKINRKLLLRIRERKNCQIVVFTSFQHFF